MLVDRDYGPSNDYAMQSPVPQAMTPSAVCPNAFRAGKPATYATARQYVDTFPPNTVSSADVEGCYRCRGCNGLCLCPVCIYMTRCCGPNCLWGIWCCCGIPIPCTAGPSSLLHEALTATVTGKAY